jgi:NAD(P)-dependent dehydrogenase (short-subunit alcohol dehydrogenase family)
MSPRTITNVSYDFRGKVVLITGGGRGQGRIEEFGDLDILVNNAGFTIR